MDNNDYETDPIDNMTFTNDKCFLCGEELNSENRTDEHVYPKWLQNKFDLWNQELILLNGTMIKYRQLTIPCCKNCNSIMSSMIEKPMEKAVRGGYEEFIKLDRKIIFQWLNKLSYGILYKELSLKKEIKNPESKSIYSEEYLKEHYTQHLMLKTIIDKSEFIFNPCSILVFRIRPYKEDGLYWAYDELISNNFFIRMNDIGIISNSMDNGSLEKYFISFPELNDILNKELHPIQFAELCAKFHYKSTLFKRDPFQITNYSLSEKKVKEIISQPIYGNAYNKWINKDYAYYLSFYWQDLKYSYEDLSKGNITSLRREDGSFNDLYN